MDVVVKFAFLPVIFQHKTKGNQVKCRKIKQAGHAVNLIERDSNIYFRVIRQTF